MWSKTSYKTTQKGRMYQCDQKPHLSQCWMRAQHLSRHKGIDGPRCWGERLSARPPFSTVIGAATPASPERLREGARGSGPTQAQHGSEVKMTRAAGDVCAGGHTRDPLVTAQLGWRPGTRSNVPTLTRRPCRAVGPQAPSVNTEPARPTTNRSYGGARSARCAASAPSLTGPHG